MSELVFSPMAESDLDETVEYIRTVRHNPIAAYNLLNRIRKQVDGLRDFPEMGPRIETWRGLSDYRRLVCGNYLAIYHIESDCVYIDRILYGRRDYLSLLFGDEDTEGDNDE